MPQRFPLSQCEVQGQAILSIVAAMALIEQRALKLLAAQGITPLEPDRWYPLERLLRVFEAIHAEIGPNTDYTPVGERTARMRRDNPCPCALDEGLLEAIGIRFRPQDSLWVRVEHQPGRCRKQGADSCTYYLSWSPRLPRVGCSHA